MKKRAKAAAVIEWRRRNPVAAGKRKQTRDRGEDRRESRHARI